MAEISFNPNLTTNAAGSFSIQSVGFVQGIAMDDPTARNTLAGGVVSDAEEYPMYGGIAISEAIPAGGVLGGVISRSTDLATITGFTTFNQGHNGITTPQSPVPLFASGMGINFWRLGSGVRIALAILGSLVSLETEQINTPVSWDFTLQQITTYDDANALPIKILDIQIGNCKNVVFNTGTGFATWTPTGDCALALI